MLVLTRRKCESLIIGDDIKITVLNVGRNQIKIGVNDSESVTINQQESISIRDDIKETVVKIDKAQVKLGIEAPADVTINMEEVYMKDQVENVLSSTSGVVTPNHISPAKKHVG